MSNISQQQALNRAFWMIKVPSMSLLFGPLITYVALAKLQIVPSIGYAGLKWALPCFLVAFIGSWLTWSVQVPRWRLWAYRRVDDVLLLEHLAVERQLIWPPGSIFEKTEIMSQSARSEIQKLRKMSEARCARQTGCSKPGDGAQVNNHGPVAPGR